jgi:hypothetical protein
VESAQKAMDMNGQTMLGRSVQINEVKDKRYDQE